MKKLKVLSSKMAKNEKPTNEKIARGQFFTKKSPFLTVPFRKWLKEAVQECGSLLIEPFAGNLDLVRFAKEIMPSLEFDCFDIEPLDRSVNRRDTISCFPAGYKIGLTNPPYLAKNSAKRKGIPYYGSRHDDLYKECLEVMLNNLDYLAAIVPMSFITSSFPKTRLKYFDEVCDEIFLDTKTPVGIAFFVREYVSDTRIYRNGKEIGTLKNLQETRREILKAPKRSVNIQFNDAKGNVGLMAVDNTLGESIRFVKPSMIKADSVKQTSRHLTIIKVDYIPNTERLNKLLKVFRKETNDVFMTAFKGIRADGEFRRRLDFTIAREILEACSSSARS